MQDKCIPSLCADAEFNINNLVLLQCWGKICNTSSPQLNFPVHGNDVLKRDGRQH